MRVVAVRNVAEVDGPGRRSDTAFVRRVRAEASDGDARYRARLESAAPLGAVTAHDVLAPLVPGRSGSGRQQLGPCVS
jgi:hypothetical protein